MTSKEDIRERLKLLKQKRVQVSNSNFREVLEENFEKSVKQGKKPVQHQQQQSYSKKGNNKVQEPVPVSEQVDSVEGVARMVDDVNQQIDNKAKRSRRRRFDDQADVDYINERNMRFNKKLERAYGPYSDEIKQNFERGTAM